MLSETVTEHGYVRQSIRQLCTIDFSFAIGDVIAIKRRRWLRHAIEIISSNDFRRLRSHAVEQENEIHQVGRHFSAKRARNRCYGIDRLIRPGNDRAANENGHKNGVKQPAKLAASPVCPGFGSWQT